MSINEDYILPAAFARLCGISKETLRFYTDIGLIKPDRVQENGYKIYSALQSPNIHLIRFMEQYGWSLAEVKTYLSARSEDSYMCMLDDIMSRQQAELRKVESSIKLIEQMKRYALRLHQLQGGPVLETATRAQTYLISPFARDMDSRETRLCASVRNHINDCEKLMGIPIYPTGRFLYREQAESGVTRYVKYLTSPVPEEVLQNYQIPKERLYSVAPGLRISDVYRGDVFSTKDAYDRIFKLMKQTDTVMDGDPLELWILTQFSTASPMDYCALIEVPVRMA